MKSWSRIPAWPVIEPERPLLTNEQKKKLAKQREIDSHESRRQKRKRQHRERMVALAERQKGQ